MTRTVLFAALLIGSMSAASAQVGTVPDPSNPTPAYPIATDGTPLPPIATDGTPLPPMIAPAGRSAAATDNFIALFDGRSTIETSRGR